jgi:ParB family chromosome partitioning protein
MGLSALLGPPPGDPAQPQSPILHLPIELLQPSSVQPRRRFSEEELTALAQSLREHGILQPLIVRRMPGSQDRYEIIAGERRWRAAQAASLHEVPVILRELDDRAALEIALVENLQREDLSPMEEAQAYRRLIEEFGHTQEILGGIVGRSRSHVANMLRLLGLPPVVRAMLEDGSLSAGHARALLGASDPETLALMVVAKGLSVRETEALVRKTARGRTGREADPNVADLERDLSRRLGLAVSIRSGANGGVVTLRYSRADQLEAILRRLA